MNLSSAERSRNHRLKLKQQEKVSVRIYIDHALHKKLKRRAALKEQTLQHHIAGILVRSSKG